MPRRTIRQNVLNLIAAQKLKEAEPEMYQQCERLVNPPLSDLSLIPAIISIITDVKPIKAENSPFIVAVVYYLYAPHKLHFKAGRPVNGIREIICKALNWNDAPVVNYYLDISLAYYKNPRWAAKVNELAEAILSEINTENNGN